LDALRKDFAQRAKPQPKAATDQRFRSMDSGGGVREPAAGAAATRPPRPGSKAAKVLVIAGRPASAIACSIRWKSTLAARLTSLQRWWLGSDLGCQFGHSTFHLNPKVGGNLGYKVPIHTAPPAQS